MTDNQLYTQRVSEAKRAAFGGFLKETSGLGVAEFASAAVSVGVFAFADKIAPDLVKQATKTVAKIIEPYLDTVESNISKLCRLEECKPDTKKPRMERAEQMARSIVLFGAAFVPSLIVKLATRRGINELAFPGKDPYPWWKIWRSSKHDGAVIAWDEGVHIGSLILLNTSASKHTDNLIRGSTSFLQKTFGWTPERAHEVSSMAMIWELPNILGLVAGTGAIAHKHFWSADAKEKIAKAAAGSGSAISH